VVPTLYRIERTTVTVTKLETDGVGCPTKITQLKQHRMATLLL